MISAKVTGLPDLREALRGIVPKLRVRALRNALAAGAKLVQIAVRARTPILKTSTYSGASAIKRGVRKPGTVRKAISIRTSKVARRAGNVGVFVNVRPAKKGSRGVRNPNDPFYWRWLNYGWNPGGGLRGAARTAGMRARRSLNRQGVAKTKPGAYFMEAGANALGSALPVIMDKMIAAIEKLNHPKAPAP